MKVTIDTTTKEITVLETVGLEELFDWLETTLGTEMGEYSIRGVERDNKFWYPPTVLPYTYTDNYSTVSKQ